MLVKIGKSTDKQFDARLEAELKDDRTLIVVHFNESDGYYCYEMTVTGTLTEIRTIKEFCDKVSSLVGNEAEDWPELSP